MSLKREKHIKYFTRHLELFPSHYIPYDSSLTSLVYFCICGLGLLGALDELPGGRAQWISWVYTNLVDSGEGFRGSASHKVTGEYAALYDPANLSSTFFCLAILAVLEDESLPERLDRRKIMGYVKQCQRPDGSFASASHPTEGPMGESDLRHTYVATGIRHVLGLGPGPSTETPDIDLDKTTDYIRSLQTYDGGLGNMPDNESHAGLTFCGVGSLHLMNRLDSDFSTPLIQWLSKRQLPEEHGGFNGRCNKDADTCYSGWIQTCLDMLNCLDIIDIDMNEDYLLNHTQHNLLGGFSKCEGNYPDPLHSFFGLASLALTQPEKHHLQSFNSPLCVPVSAVDHLSKLKW